MIFSKKSLEFPSSVIINDIEYIIEVSFFKKKTSSVIFKGNKIVFRLSSYLTYAQTKKHFEELLEGISKKIAKSPVQKVVTIEDILEVGYFIFSGEKYFLEYTKNIGVRLRENIFYINSGTKIEIIEKKIIVLLSQRYYLRLRNYVLEKNAQTYNFVISGFELKNLKSKWGHCTHDNRLMFNLRLLNAPIEVLDYVIFHELSHIKVKNHSKLFWDEVAKFCKNYKYYRKVLKDNPPQIFKLE